MINYLLKNNINDKLSLVRVAHPMITPFYLFLVSCTYTNGRLIYNQKHVPKLWIRHYLGRVNCRDGNIHTASCQRGQECCKSLEKFVTCRRLLMILIIQAPNNYLPLHDSKKNMSRLFLKNKTERNNYYIGPWSLP